MTLAYFRKTYGERFYSFINSELGQAMLLVLSSNDPADSMAKQPPKEQSKFAKLFIGQVTGWRACIATQRDLLIVQPGAPIEDPEATYEPEDPTQAGGGRGDNLPAEPAPTPAAPVPSTRSKKQPRRKHR
jgi:hypothetical protein